MKAFLLHDKVPVDTMRTLNCVAPLYIIVHCESDEHAESMRILTANTIRDFPEVNLRGLGFASIVLSEVYETFRQFEICVYGNYITAMMDLYEWFESYADCGVKVNYYVNDDEPVCSLDSMYFDSDIESNFMDSFSFRPRSGNNLWEVILRCQEFIYSIEVDDCSPKDLCKKWLDSVDMEVADIFEESNWKNPKVDIPAAVLFVCCGLIVDRLISDCVKEENGDLSVSISFCHPAVLYKRSDMKMLFSLIDEALISGEKIYWQNIFDIFDDEISSLDV